MFSRNPAGKISDMFHGDCCRRVIDHIAVHRDDVSSFPTSVYIFGLTVTSEVKKDTIIQLYLFGKFMEKFGQDSIAEINNNFKNYLKQIKNF